MVKNYFDLDVFIWIFRLLLKIFIIIINLHKKVKKESVIIFHKKKFEQYKKNTFLIVGDKCMSEMHLKQTVVE